MLFDRDLVQRLLCVDRDKRIGNGNSGMVKVSPSAGLGQSNPTTQRYNTLAIHPNIHALFPREGTADVQSHTFFKELIPNTNGGSQLDLNGMWVQLEKKLINTPFLPRVITKLALDAQPLTFCDPDSILKP